MSQNPAKLAALLAELKVDYLEKFPEKIQRLQSLTEAEDWKALHEEFHKLKGTGKTYGFPEVSILCEQLERLSGEQQTQDQDLFLKALELFERMYQRYAAGENFDLESDPVASMILSK